MTDLSSAARAIWEAFNSKFDWVEDGVPGPQFHSVAAALRAAAEEVVPYEATAPWDELKCDYDGDHWEMRQYVRDKFLAIAAELEGAE